MEAVYLWERTCEGPSLLSPTWMGPKPRTRFPIPPIDTRSANDTPVLQTRQENLPETPSPHSKDDFTPCASPSTAFTTPDASPKLGTLFDSILEQKSTISRLEAENKGLKAELAVWKARHLTDVIRERQRDEQLYKDRVQLIIGDKTG